MLYASMRAHVRACVFHRAYLHLASVCWKLPLCEKEGQKCFSLRSLWMTGGGRWRLQWEMPVNLPGFEELLLLDCLAQTQQPMRRRRRGGGVLFLKTQERRLGSGERVEGEEAQRAAAKQSRHLTLAPPRLHRTSFYLTWISLLDPTFCFF